MIEVYWLDNQHDHYTPSNRVRSKLSVNKPETFSFEINPLCLTVRSIRIDPTNASGTLNIKKIEITYSNESLIKINVGCGPKDHKPGWVNVDIQPFPTVDRVMDVTKEWDFKNVSFVYAEHFIEHLTLEQGINFLYNAGKSMRNDGWIRLSTPNVV